MKKGFSLIELIVVIVVLAIISAVAVISLSPAKSIKLSIAANKIAGDLSYARNTALSSGKWFGLSFEASPANTYSIYQTDGTTDVLADNPAKPNATFTVNLAADFSGVNLQSLNIGGGTKVEFSPLGIPYTDKLAAAISANGLITLESAGLTKTIVITPNTGRVTTQ